jgi:hypothetical protein
MRVVVAVTRTRIPRRVAMLVGAISIVAAIAVVAAADSEGSHDR